MRPKAHQNIRLFGFIHDSGLRGFKDPEKWLAQKTLRANVDIQARDNISPSMGGKGRG